MFTTSIRGTTNKQVGVVASKHVKNKLCLHGETLDILIPSDKAAINTSICLQSFDHDFSGAISFLSPF